MHAAGEYEALAPDDEGDGSDADAADDMTADHDDDEDAEPQDSKRPRR